MHNLKLISALTLICLINNSSLALTNKSSMIDLIKQNEPSILFTNTVKDPNHISLDGTWSGNCDFKDLLKTRSYTSTFKIRESVSPAMIDIDIQSDGNSSEDGREDHVIGGMEQSTTVSPNFPTASLWTQTKYTNWDKDGQRLIIKTESKIHYLTEDFFHENRNYAEESIFTLEDEKLIYSSIAKSQNVSRPVKIVQCKLSKNSRDN